MPNMEEEIKKQGLEEWAPYAKVYVDRFAAEEIKYKVKQEVPDQVKTFSKEQKQYLSFLAKQLDKKWEANEFQKKLYEWAKENNLSSTDAFRAIYISLLGKDYGPKAAWIILKEDKEFVKKRFNED